jgi:hypothetical protein
MPNGIHGLRSWHLPLALSFLPFGALAPRNGFPAGIIWRRWLDACGERLRDRGEISKRGTLESRASLLYYANVKETPEVADSAAES